MEPMTLLEEGALNPHDRRHTCPRCGEVARSMSQAVYAGGLVRLACPDGHQWTVHYLDLPAAVLAPAQAAA